MSINNKYNPTDIEKKWYDYWMRNDFFSSVPDEREPYTIVIPPPNVTGVLHMGHMLNNTIQDVLIRRARMLGYNACWVPGTDHASIATETKVVNLLREQGINKRDIGREKFLEHAFEWKEKYGGIILDQLKRLGASCDWKRTRFTMESKLSDAVIQSFVELYNKGYVYKDWKIVNWDPKAQTTLSNEEVIRKEVNSNLYYVKYKIVGEEGYVTVATTRPETIMGDVAICVHPKDDRYFHLHGKKVIVPMVNREVPIICDDYIDKEFGTGMLKVTPAHDTNDYEIGLRHGLEVIDTFNDDGTISEVAGIFVGEDRFVVRKKTADLLQEQGLLEKTEQITNNVGYSERNPDTVVEPKLSLQWFVKMDEMVKPALEHVMNDDIQLFPAKFKNVYQHWLENIRDWPISRQLWWGQQIPAFYYNEQKDFVVAKTKEEALQLAKEKSGNNNLAEKDLIQDEDVLDTWFSSWLWPISVFDGFEENSPDFDYYYPTNVLVTGWDIIFFWVARMVFAGYEFKNEKPFKDVYFTGMVRDKQRRKMSKSLGNSPDALALIDQYGADGVRFGMLSCAAAGNDLLFDETLCEQGSKFSTKMWNAFRLVKGWEVDTSLEQPESAKIAIEWFESKMNETLEAINDNFSKYRLSDALMSTYKLIWNDFCSWYLEGVKPEYQQPIDAITLKATITYFEQLLKMLHPFMPFVTEELWQNLEERKNGETIMLLDFPQAGNINESAIEGGEDGKEIISNIRNIRAKYNMSPKQDLTLYVKSNNDLFFKELIIKLGNIHLYYDDQWNDEGEKTAEKFVIKSTEYVIPIARKITNEEIEKIKTDLEYAKGLLAIVDKKLANEKFVNGAPEQVVAAEKKKKADAEAKIKVLEEQLMSLNK
ncbi:MAG: valine--tRNA ligase [Flavobacteriales bacterium]|mgnify:CR=1 FL=1|jgi:valyl-tRNA synthetase|nr:valine--tRNA ligase [Flavobacteriales bacterium]MBQ19714.1 valine--tRNA ligase [Flavobacteriales bacterium]|tara:strand:- start:53626 stop:56256 length:2631 start_codon:yes stop_codon:yes gene_type:complete